MPRAKTIALCLASGVLATFILAWTFALNMSWSERSWYHYDVSTGALDSYFHFDRISSPKLGVWAADAGNRTCRLSFGWPAPAGSVRWPTNPADGASAGFDPHWGRTVPLTPAFPGFVIDVLFWSGAAWLVLVMPTHNDVRRILRRRRGCCPRCGYDLTGLHDCPECGAASPP